jgi:hypothetical protein
MSAVPATNTTTTAAPRLRARVARRSKTQTALKSRALAFATIVASTYLVSSLFGQVMVEKARREGISAVARASDARKMEAVLTRRLDSLTSLTSVDQWAKTHNFFPPDQLAAAGLKPGVVVPGAPTAAAPGSPASAAATVKVTAPPTPLDTPVAPALAPPAGDPLTQIAAPPVVKKHKKHRDPIAVDLAPDAIAAPDKEVDAPADDAAPADAPVEAAQKPAHHRHHHVKAKVKRTTESDATQGDTQLD